jgi:hypothetical protein
MVGDDGARDFPFSAYFCTSLEPPLTCVSWLKTLVVSEGYHVVG